MWVVQYDLSLFISNCQLFSLFLFFLVFLNLLYSYIFLQVSKIHFISWIFIIKVFIKAWVCLEDWTIWAFLIKYSSFWRTRFSLRSLNLDKLALNYSFTLLLIHFLNWSKGYFLMFSFNIINLITLRNTAEGNFSLVYLWVNL